MEQWVKNPTVVAQVAEEVWVPSPARCSELKDPKSLQHRSQLQLGSDSVPGPGNLYMLWVQPQKEKKTKKRLTLLIPGKVDFIYSFFYIYNFLFFSHYSWFTVSEWPSLNPQITNSGGGVKKREPSYTVGGNVNWYNHYGVEYGQAP